MPPTPKPASTPPLLRRQSTQSQPAVTSRSASLAELPLPRRQSTQERINEILEAARDRADTMGTTTGRSPSLNQMPNTIEREEPDEYTGIMMAPNQRNYQSTETSISPRRRPNSQANGPQPYANGVTNGVTNGSADHDTEGDGHGHTNALVEWFSSLWSIELENKGSTARDHLALERTFLAWLRTSLAFASIGIAVTQLFRLNTSLIDGKDPHFDTIRHLGKPLGATFLGISVLVLFLGFQRYQQSQRWVMKGKYPASRGSIIVVAFIAFALMAVSLIVVIVVQPIAAL